MEPTIGIITALEHEYIAVRIMFDRFTEYRVPGQGAGRRYDLGEVDGLSGGMQHVVLSLADKGLSIASRRASLMLEHFPSIRCILMVGIACGVPNPKKAEAHVRLGDIVVSDNTGVLQYDFRKLENGIEENRGRWAPSDAELIEARRLLSANALTGFNPWEDYIREGLTALRWKRPPARSDILFDSLDPATQVNHPSDKARRPGQPRVFAGPIGASNTLLKHARRRDQLRDTYGFRAIEMEGSGIADASWEHRSGYMIIRGICDYGDCHKGDAWQQYAAVAAAAYAKALIKAMPTSFGARLPAVKSAVAPTEKLTANGWLPSTGGDLLDAAYASVLVRRDSESAEALPLANPFIDMATRFRQLGCSMKLEYHDGSLALKAEPRPVASGTRPKLLPLSEIEGSRFIYQPRQAPALTLSWNDRSHKFTLKDDHGNTLIVAVGEPPTQ